MNIAGKTTVVTGGTKGIGYAIAESLVKADAKVVICGRSRNELHEAKELLATVGQAGGCVCDVRAEEQVRSMLADCERIFGGVDILVNNAGMGFFDKTVEETSSDEFRQ